MRYDAKVIFSVVADKEHDLVVLAFDEDLVVVTEDGERHLEGVQVLLRLLAHLHYHSPGHLGPASVVIQFVLEQSRRLVPMLRLLRVRVENEYGFVLQDDCLDIEPLLYHLLETVLLFFQSWSLQLSLLFINVLDFLLRRVVRL